jgi:hypothetical protein
VIATTVDESGTRRAVTKLVEGERLVSCTCCTAADITCCLLDTQLDLDLFPNGAITQDKLPPTIVLDDVQYSLGTLGYGDTTDGVFLESGVWAVYKSGVRTTRRCLVSNIATDIEDEFPDTLTLTYTAFGHTVTANLTRVSLCRYEGTDDSEACSGSITHNNSSNLQSANGNNWFLQGFTRLYEDGFHSCGSLQFSTNLDQNTPTGTYSGEFAEDIDGNPVTVTITVTTP